MAKKRGRLKPPTPEQVVIATRDGVEVFRLYGSVDNGRCRLEYEIDEKTELKYEPLTTGKESA